MCHRDIVSTISDLACYRGMHVCVTLALERPFADLHHILAMLRRHKNMVEGVKGSEQQYVNI